MLKDINHKLNEMRIASTNDGGRYHFTKLVLPEGQDMRTRLKSYLEGIPAFSNPTMLIGDKEMIITDRDLRNLKLIPIEDLKITIDKKCSYWKNHETSLDEKKSADAIYPLAEQEFKNELFKFLSTLDSLQAYQLKGIDTNLAKELGGDHVGDEIIFESKKAVHVLHFGWSS